MSITIKEFPFDDCSSEEDEYMLPAGCQLVVPGDVVVCESGSLKGKGLIQDEDGRFVTTICGFVRRVNKLVYVCPIKQRYSGEIGDVVIGRIAEIQSDRWMVDFGGHQYASLPIGGVTLPNSEQRRRVDDDKLQMRDYFKEGDLVSCEIQRILESSGDVFLHMRSHKYGTLRNGHLVKVTSSLVKRQSSHVLRILEDDSTSFPVYLVLGLNGWIWIGLPPRQTGFINSINFTQIQNSNESVDHVTRQKIVAVGNCISSLASNFMEISLESILCLVGLMGASMVPSASVVRQAKSILLDQNVS